MALKRYGFIVKSAELDMFKHHGQIASENFNMSVAGVRDVTEAVLVAQEMLTRQVQLIELCGGFSSEEAQKIRAAVLNRIPVGYVQYNYQERERLASEFA